MDEQFTRNCEFSHSFTMIFKFVWSWIQHWTLSGIPKSFQIPKECLKIYLSNHSRTYLDQLLDILSMSRKSDELMTDDKGKSQYLKYIFLFWAHFIVRRLSPRIIFNITKTLMHFTVYLIYQDRSQTVLLNHFILNAR